MSEANPEAQQPLEAASAVATEAGGEAATVVPSADTATENPPGGAVAASEETTASGVGGGGGAAGTRGEGDGTNGGSPASEPAKVEGSNKEMTAAESNVPVKEPLGPGPYGLEDFDTGVTLGTGSFGRVRIATHKTTQTPWAIKILKKAEIVRMQQVRTVQGGYCLAWCHTATFLWLRSPRFSAISCVE